VILLCSSTKDDWVLSWGTCPHLRRKRDESDATAARKINAFPLFLKLNPVIFIHLLFDFLRFEFKLRKKKTDFSEIFIYMINMIKSTFSKV
jgi:hypothetical protein